MNIINLGGDFGKVDLRTVAASLWKPDNLVSDTWVSNASNNG